MLPHFQSLTFDDVVAREGILYIQCPSMSLYVVCVSLCAFFSQYDYA